MALEALQDPNPDEPPPLCSAVTLPKGSSPSVVRIDIDKTNGKPTPEDCHVAPYSTVWWWQGDDVEFETEFETGLPTNGQKHFKSKKIKQVRFAGFKVKHLQGDPVSYKYKVMINGIVVDPTVIIDP